jgi:hypothetical protein
MFSIKTLKNAKKSINFSNVFLETCLKRKLENYAKNLIERNTNFLQLFIGVFLLIKSDITLKICLKIASIFWKFGAVRWNVRSLEKLLLLLQKRGEGGCIYYSIPGRACKVYMLTGYILNN